MPKPITFEFEGNTYELPHDLVKKYQKETYQYSIDIRPGTSLHALMYDENPFSVNPFPNSGSTIQDWYDYEMTRLRWFEAATAKARKYVFGWRYWFSVPQVFYTTAYAIFAVGFITYILVSVFN